MGPTREGEMILSLLTSTVLEFCVRGKNEVGLVLTVSSKLLNDSGKEVDRSNGVRADTEDEVDVHLEK